MTKVYKTRTLSYFKTDKSNCTEEEGHLSLSDNSVPASVSEPDEMLESSNILNLYQIFDQNLVMQINNLTKTGEQKVL